MSFKTEAEHHIHTIADRPGLTTDQENVQSMEKKNTQLVPLTVGLCLAVFLLSVDRTIDAVAGPHISNQFHSFSDIGWYGSAYFIALCCVRPVFGKVYSVLNTKWSYVAGFAVFEIESLVCALAPNSASLIIGRAVAGAGTGGVLFGSYVITAQTVPMRIRPAYTAAVAIMFSLGAIVAPLIGAAFTQHASWRWCFYINLPVGCPVLVGIVLLFRPPENAGVFARPMTIMEKLSHLDLPGAALLLGSTTMLLMALQYAAADIAGSSPLITGLLSGVGACTIAFMLWQLKQGDNALIPLRILKQRTVFASIIANIAMYAALVTYVYFLPIYFQAIKDRTIVKSAVDLLPLIICCSVFSIIAGVLVTKTLYFTPPAIVGTALAFVGSALLTMLQRTTSVQNWAGYQTLVGVGLGLALQTGFFGVQAVLPATDIPVGTSLITFAQSLGGALGVSIGNTILLYDLRTQSSRLAEAGVNVEVVIKDGATGFRDFVDAESLTALLADYNGALGKVFIMAVVFSAIAWISTCFMERTKS